jgi:hypothetical protein
MEYKISRDFTDTPGGRFKSLGEYSGEEFRDDILINILNNLKDGEKLTLNLDGVYGYPPSFLEEVFGGLIRNYNYNLDKIKEKIKFVSLEQPERINEIYDHIKKAEEEMENNVHENS